MGEKDLFKTLAEFQEIRYNNDEKYRSLQEFKQYRARNPETQISREEYQTVVKIKEIGVKGEPILNPKKIDTETFTYRDEHINISDHNRGLSREKAESFIEKSIFMLKQRGGKRLAFYSRSGATVVDVESKEIVTSFSVEDFDSRIVRAIKEIKENE